LHYGGQEVMSKIGQCVWGVSWVINSWMLPVMCIEYSFVFGLDVCIEYSYSYKMLYCVLYVCVYFGIGPIVTWEWEWIVGFD